jgi:hypothetical protein
MLFHHALKTIFIKVIVSIKNIQGKSCAYLLKSEGVLFLFDRAGVFYHYFVLMTSAMDNLLSEDE